MAAEMTPTPLDEILLTADDNVDGRIRIIQTLANSRVHVVTDLDWDGRSAPNRNMRLVMVSDGPNQQQAMLAVFSNRDHAIEYLQSIQGPNPFHNIAEVPMHWALLGIPPRAGIMLNPNSSSGFRISPEVTAELRRGAQAVIANRPASNRDTQQGDTKSARQPPPDQAGRALLSEVQQALDSGDPTTAERKIGSATDADISEGFLLASRALVMRYRKDYSSALEQIRRATDLVRDDHTAGQLWSLLAQIAEDAKDPEQAEFAYSQACASEPGNMRYSMDIARFKASQYRMDEALRTLEDLIHRHPDDPAPAIYIGNLLMDDGQHEKALAALDEAVRRHPSAAGAHFNRGVCLQMLGRVEESRHAFEKAITLDPALDGHHQYMNVRKTSPEDAGPDSVYRQLLERRAADDMPLSTRIDSCFALAKLFDQAGDKGHSFEYLQRGNSLKRSTLQWTMADTQKDVEKSTAIFDADFIARYRGQAASELAPIFVLGMPRSGTTLTEQILAAHSKVNAGGELLYLSHATDRFTDQWAGRTQELTALNPDAVQALREVALRYDELTRSLQVPGKRFTDKMPGNYLNIGFIYLLFPNASVIHCHRNPIDNCLSCYERLFTKGLNFSYNMTELGEYYRLYMQVMQKWREIIPREFILDLEYEQLVADPESQIRRLLDFCGLEFEEACLNFHEVKRTVTTASALQVRKPLYNTSVARWKIYGDRLKPLLDALGASLTGEGG